jgi:phosphatidyl-myo-inositol alpha-mannosyltransferase
MKIALVHPYTWPEVRRGAERYLDDLAWALVGLGHEVDVLTTTPALAASQPFRHVAVRRPTGRLRRLLASIGFGPLESFGAMVLPRLLTRRYDVLHAMVPAAAVAGWLARQPTVYTIIGHPAPGTPSARLRLPRRLMTTALRRATVSTSLSEASAAEVQAVFGHRPAVLAPGVRLDRFPPALGPRRGPPRILFSAFAEDRRKGLDTLVRALPLVLRNHPEARLAISGAGDPRWALEGVPSVARAIDVLGPGTLEDVPARYRDATVTVLPARNEAFGLALVESLASGTPVVCSDSGGMPEIVTSEAVGRVVPPGDEQALAAGICQAIALAADPETPRRCVDHATRWGWAERVGAEHERVYRRVAGDHG